MGLEGSSFIGGRRRRLWLRLLMAKKLPLLLLFNLLSSSPEAGKFNHILTLGLRASLEVVLCSHGKVLCRDDVATCQENRLR